jgi:hypothetical protein
LVDANGDGVLDIAGMGGAPGSERWRLQVIDGATGRRLWAGDTYTYKARIVCLPPRFFGVDDTDFRLHLFPARTPDAPMVVALQDHVSQVGLGKDCVRIAEDNRQEQVISLVGNHVDRCNADLVENQGVGEYQSRIDNNVELAVQGARYAVSHRSPGTPFIIASKSKDGRPLWTANLPFVPTDDGVRLVATPDMLVVWGADPSRTEYATMIGLDVNTGNTRYAVTQNSHWSSHFVTNFLYNGRYVVVGWGYGLHAYDPNTGERVWHIGGR